MFRIDVFPQREKKKKKKKKKKGKGLPVSRVHIYQARHLAEWMDEDMSSPCLPRVPVYRFSSKIEVQVGTYSYTPSPHPHSVVIWENQSLIEKVTPSRNWTSTILILSSTIFTSSDRSRSFNFVQKYLTKIFFWTLSSVKVRKIFKI